MATFDLISRPWIPCYSLEGVPEFLGLQSVFAKAHQLREVLDDSPLATAALHRLLLAILHRVYGPKNLKAWKELRERRVFGEEVSAYLTKWRHRFDLFDAERPFAQRAGLTGEELGPQCLCPQLASGNNATLFDHTRDEAPVAMDAAAGARALLSVQTFDAGGRRPGSADYQLAAPLASSAMTLMRGASLFETLLFNLVEYDPSRAKPIPGTANDRPAWEREESVPKERVPNGYLDLLTWTPRQRLLRVDSVTGAIKSVVCGDEGDRFPKDARPIDPLVAYRLDKERGPLPLRFNADRALWRDSTALLAPEGGALQPEPMKLLASLVLNDELPISALVNCEVSGWAGDQAKIFLWRRELLPVPLALLNQTNMQDAVRQAISMAQEADWAVRRATGVLAEKVLAPSGRRVPGGDVTNLVQATGASRRFWSQLEVGFHGFLRALPSDADRAAEAWQKTLRETAIAAFAAARDSLATSAHGLRGAALAEVQLRGSLAELFPTANTVGTSNAQAAGGSVP